MFNHKTLKTMADEAQSKTPPSKASRSIENDALAASKAAPLKDKLPDHRTVGAGQPPLDDKGKAADPVGYAMKVLEEEADLGRARNTLLDVSFSHLVSKGFRDYPRPLKELAAKDLKTAFLIVDREFYHFRDAANAEISKVAPELPLAEARSMAVRSSAADMQIFVKG